MPLPKLISDQVGSAFQSSPYPVGGRFLLCHAVKREHFSQFQKVFQNNDISGLTAGCFESDVSLWCVWPVVP